MPQLALDATHAHLWYVFQDEISDPTLLRRYHEWMTHEEATQQQRFVNERLRHEYLVTRALCRWTLSLYADVLPAAWRFRRNEYGRPEIASPSEILPLRFNLANTRGLIACLVTKSVDAGVDVEDTSRPGETVGIADRFFSRVESEALKALPEDGQHPRFFEYWTLKEAYIKARGMGLSLPLEQFSYHLHDNAPITISFDPRLNDTPAIWQFALYRPSRQHMMAVALKRGLSPDIQIEVRMLVPGTNP